MSRKRSDRMTGGRSLGLIVGALLVLAVASVGLVAGAFALIGTQRLFEDCECPVFEQAAASIDWLGDGRAPDDVESYAIGTDLHVTITYRNLGDHAAATETYDELRNRLEKWQSGPTEPK